MKVPITRCGYRRLQNELLHLRRVVRPTVLEDLQEARAFGVKTDNQQYLLAKERHTVLLRKIEELESKLGGCEVFAGRKFHAKRVSFGAITVIKNMDTGATHRYQLVGPYESDVREGKLSIESPVGRCLMGCSEGDEVTVFTPSGIRVYFILSIQI
ncbi:GreA/GreB family elongation factor [Desulforhabdus amnigena]|uniref:Transcription elongation factor GreA n=1 Tax=Desulforhabdus amnigena TaxID=40218 RepID=A0A9W6D3Z9_9BACT|nr:transcription elongation factor GreA [Desulforhabdus amnigena]GLI34479.1 transcription elongation factor GreA [Desulforhabdus amnigena]